MSDLVSESRRKLRLLSLNLWNLNDPLSSRMANLDSFLNSHPQDVVVFQEVSPESAATLQTDRLQFLADYGSCYQATGEWQGRAEGLSIYSRFPIVRTAAFRLPGAESDMDRGLLRTDLDLGDQTIHVFNTHLAFRLEDEALRQRQAEVVASHVRELLAETADAWVVLCGDFNDVPDSPTLETFRSTGLEEVFSGDEAERFTFSSDNIYVKPVLHPDRRIDHILVSPSVSVVSSSVVLDAPDALASDHYGLCLEVML